MKKLFQWSAIIVGIILLAGCATTPKVTNVEISATPLKVGKQAEVATQVVDGRPGIVNKNPSLLDSTIEANVKVSQLVPEYLTQVQKALQQNEFVSVPYRPNIARKLTLQITSLRYNDKTDSIFEGAKITASVEADATNGMQTYSQVYSGYVTIGTGFGSNDKQIPAAVNRLLNKLFSQVLGNKQLMQFLAK